VRRFTSQRVVPVLLGLVPAAVAAAWIPFRDDLPNTDVALILVLCVGAVAMFGGRWAAVIGALTAATAFDFFDTSPYGQLYMTRGRDVATTLILAGAGLLVGELCLRVRQYRVMATTRGEDFTVISSAARLMAVGEDASMVVEALAGELVTRLGLADCEFLYGPPTGDSPCIARDGSLIDLGPRVVQAPVTEIDLPVWAGAEVVGRYRLSLGQGPLPARDRLLAAVGIAEQAGAALAASNSSLSPAPGPSRPRRLHLLR
jgi:Domain of unknown function (DUF4118)